MSDFFYEKRVIGGVLAGLISPADVGLDHTDFSSPDLGELWRAIGNCDPSLPLDPSLVLEKTDDIPFYSVTDIESWMKRSSSVAGVHEAIQHLKRSACQRFILDGISEIQRRDDLSGGQLLSSLRNLTQEAETRFINVGGSFRSLEELRDRVLGVVDDLAEGKSFAIPTGYPLLDKEFPDGYIKGDLHVIVGLTGTGKTTLALNFMLNQALNGYKVGLLSREMSDIENVNRLVSNFEDLERWKIATNMSTTTRERFLSAFNKLSRYEIRIDCDTATVEALRANVKYAVSQGQLDILYVDYLQLLRFDRGVFGSRAEEVARLSRQLKEIAMENQIPVVALSQFNRGAMNADTSELLNHLKESSGIEQDAATVLYIVISKDRKPMVIDAQAMLLKNRHGRSLARIPLRFRGEVFRFMEDKDYVDSD